MNRIEFLLIALLASSLMGCSTYRSSRYGADLPHFAVRFASGDSGYVSLHGSPVIKGYDEAGEFSEGRAWCRKGDTIYLINGHGRVVFQQHVKDQVDLGYPFSGGVSWVHLGVTNRLVSRSGVTIATIAADRARRHREGLSAVRRDGKWGYCDYRGNEVVSCQFGYAGDFHEGLAVVATKEDKLWGYIRPDGAYAIPAQFRMAQDFEEGWAAVLDDDGWFFIDREGRRVLDAPCEEVAGFKDGVAVGCVGSRCGWFNREGEWVVKPSYLSAWAANEGLIAVESEDHRPGYVTVDGEEHISPDFWWGKPFEGGFARVMWPTSAEGIIDHNGRVIWRESK